MSIKNITRHLTTTSTGWLVRVRSMDQTSRRYFADSTYGGKQKALHAAIRCRDQMCKSQRDGRVKCP